jgi:hypothetical protein
MLRLDHSCNYNKWHIYIWICVSQVHKIFIYRTISRIYRVKNNRNMQKNCYFVYKSVVYIKDRIQIFCIFYQWVNITAFYSIHNSLIFNSFYISWYEVNVLKTTLCENWSLFSIQMGFSSWSIFMLTCYNLIEAMK